MTLVVVAEEKTIAQTVFFELLKEAGHVTLIRWAEDVLKKLLIIRAARFFVEIGDGRAKTTTLVASVVSNFANVKSLGWFDRIKVLPAIDVVFFGGNGSLGRDGEGGGFILQEKKDNDKDGYENEEDEERGFGRFSDEHFWRPDSIMKRFN